jgi:hypothetical protein
MRFGASAIFCAQDRKEVEGIVQRLLDTKPVKREDVKVSKKKPEKLIPPQK